MVQTSTVVTASVATAAAGFVAYAVYFDYMRRRSSDFRRSLRRNERRKARAEKEEAEAAVSRKRQGIKIALMQALAQGFPTDVSQKEAYFMEQVAAGETLSANPETALDAAIAFYKALKVYPTPSDLIRIYDQTVPKHVLDFLAEIIALDGGLSSSSLFGPSPAAAAAAAATSRSAPSGTVEDVTGNVDSDPEEVELELESETAAPAAAAAQDEEKEVKAEAEIAEPQAEAETEAKTVEKAEETPAAAVEEEANAETEAEVEETKAEAETEKEHEEVGSEAEIVSVPSTEEEEIVVSAPPAAQE
ncbi:hypothetical protein TD95_002392 [Thielaviopsis punctulata]|uniref:Mitochondrial import receptor subunit TOM20 n=1 Tax=Thielaviopsis punctulata TaxID=72032 RepID=A0A0F4ZAJ1_9PEZI|nr:hypothetical protein TD95_002392 [Thielaviopsis punctulata]